MRFWAPAVLAVFGSVGAANASSLDYTKLYYFDYTYTPGPLTVERYENWDDPEELEDPWYSTEYRPYGPFTPWPWLNFGFYLTSSTHPDFNGATYSFDLRLDENGGFSGGKGDEYAYWFSLYWDDCTETNDCWYYDDAYLSGDITFDDDLNIIAWDFLVSLGADYFDVRSEPLDFDDEVAALPEWLVGQQYYSSWTWDPDADLISGLFATSRGSWSRTVSTYCWGSGIDDEGTCPDPSMRLAAVPLPASLPLLAGGLLLLAAARRVRRRAA